MTTEPTDRDDVLAMVTHWYGCLLTARPNLIDHNASEKERHRLMRVLIADAEALNELVYGDDDAQPLFPKPGPLVVSDEDEAA